MCSRRHPALSDVRLHMCDVSASFPGVMRLVCLPQDCIYGMLCGGAMYLYLWLCSSMVSEHGNSGALFFS